ncbi:hypothetical protein DFH11DRAFT_1047165 [Phellopilus nigrolimitatus]|nr:hypothetical protein DFH11DRAFT_1047165 [Phellopilus nigrolimitatus]
MQYLKFLAATLFLATAVLASPVPEANGLQLEKSFKRSESIEYGYKRSELEKDFRREPSKLEDYFKRSELEKDFKREPSQLEKDFRREPSQLEKSFKRSELEKDFKRQPTQLEKSFKRNGESPRLRHLLKAVY